MRYNTASLANVVVIVLSLLLLLLFPCSSCYKVKIKAWDSDCFWANVDGDSDSVTGSFVVVNYELILMIEPSGVEFNVTSPTGNIVLKVNETPEDKFEFKPPTPGLYKFCFYNNYHTPQFVDFHLHINNHNNNNNSNNNNNNNNNNSHLIDAKDEYYHLDHPVSVRIHILRRALESATAEVPELCKCSRY